MSLPFCLLALLTVASAVRLSDFTDEEITLGNKYIDDLLDEMLKEQGDYYDPYLIDDRVISFHKHVVFVNVTGEAKLFNGYITGLKSARRTGDCTLQREGERIKVTADLGAGVLDFFYSGTVKFMSIGPTITVHGILAYVEITMEFTVDANTGKDGVLEGFYADDMRGMVVKITGLGPLNWALNTLISAVTSIFSGYIKGLLEGKVEKYIGERIREYEFPVTISTSQTPEVTQSHSTDSLM